MHKKDLAGYLFELGIPVYDNKIRKSDIHKVFAATQVTASTIPLDFIKKIINTLKLKLKSKKDLDTARLNDFIKKKTSGDLMQFAKDAIMYFKQGKLKWDDEFGLLQNEYSPKGFEVIPWSYLKRQLEDLSPEIEKTIPKALQAN